MKNLLEYILIHIVDHPDAVKIEVQETAEGTVYAITVHPEDMGRVIGKKGAVIQSIRTIARIRAVKEGVRINITIVEPEERAEAHKTDAQVEEESEAVKAEAQTSEDAPDAAPEVDSEVSPEV